MNEPVEIEFKLSPTALDFSVSVRLRRVGGRWVADSNAGGLARTAIGTTPRAALMASLDHLGAGPVKALLADLGLLEPSVQLLAMTAAAG